MPEPDTIAPEVACLEPARRHPGGRRIVIGKPVLNPVLESGVFFLKRVAGLFLILNVAEKGGPGQFQRFDRQFRQFLVVHPPLV